MLHSGQTSILPALLACPIPEPLDAILERLTGLREIRSVYASLQTLVDGRPIFAKLLQHLEITYRVAEKDLDGIPRTGPAVLVVNHPFGILEGAVLATILSGIRPDVKFLANSLLASVSELRDFMISVDPMGGPEATRANPRALREALNFLKHGGLLVVFPAGEVSHLRLRELAVTDPSWSPSVARMLGIAAGRVPELAVIPAYVAGANSALFQALGLLHPRFRTVMLVRELLNKRRRHVTVRVGKVIAAQKLIGIPTDRERIDYLRWRTYLLASRHEYKPRTSWPLSARGPRATVPAAIAAATSPDLMQADVSQLPEANLLARSGEMNAYIAPASAIPAVLAEIGRLREVTFRSAGEGTGRAVDLDPFDAAYLHLFVWNARKREVVGAYRIARTDQVPDLYTATLFHYGPVFLDRIGPALELGRSFVRAEYQKSYAPLLLLWKGIGTYVSRYPRYKTLFGPVSISNQYQAISRELMVSFLERHASLSGWMGLVSARHSFRRGRARVGLPHDRLDVDDLSAAVCDIEPAQSGVPVLLRQYLKLGGKLLGFNVDPKFSNTLDGLILVDLTRTEPRLLERYLGRTEAAAFLAFHRGAHGAQ